MLISVMLVWGIAGCQAAQLHGAEESFPVNTISESAEETSASESSTENPSGESTNEAADSSGSKPVLSEKTLFLTYDGNETTISYPNIWSCPSKVYKGIATGLTVLGMLRNGFACDKNGIVQYFYNRAEYFDNGLIGLSYIDNIPELEEYYPFEAPSFNFYALYNADFSVANVQLDIAYDNDPWFHGIGYFPSFDMYMVAFSIHESNGVEASAAPLLLQAFNARGERISDPITVPEIEIVQAQFKNKIIYCTMIEANGEMLIIGEFDRKLGADEEEWLNLLLDLNTMTYSTINKEETIRLVNSTERYRWCDFDDIGRFFYSSQVMEVMQTPPFKIELSEEMHEIRIVRTDTEEVLTTLPSSYYLIDWESTGDGGFCAVFNDATNDISEFWRYSVSLQPWDSRSADIFIRE